MDKCTSKLNYSGYDIQTPKMRIEINGGLNIKDIINKTIKDVPKSKFNNGSGQFYRPIVSTKKRMSYYDLTQGK